MSENFRVCEIAQELLPLYLEQKTGEESNLFLQKHLGECQECQKVYQFMSADFSAQIKKNEGSKNETQNHRRKHISSKSKKVILLIAVLVGYVLLMAGIVIYTFLYLTGF